MTRKPRLRPRAYDVLDDAVTAGTTLGWNRAHKHDDKPQPPAIRAAIVDAIMTELVERFDLGDE